MTDSEKLRQVTSELANGKTDLLKEALILISYWSFQAIVLRISQCRGGRASRRSNNSISTVIMVKNSGLTSKLPCFSSRLMTNEQVAV